jgi:hypothetical protein
MDGSSLDSLVELMINDIYVTESEEIKLFSTKKKDYTTRESKTSRSPSLQPPSF